MRRELGKVAKFALSISVNRERKEQEKLLLSIVSNQIIRESLMPFVNSVNTKGKRKFNKSTMVANSFVSSQSKNSQRQA